MNSVQCRRILYIIDGLEGDGAERQLCELVKGIHKHPNYEPHVIALEPNDNGHAWMLEEQGIAVNVFARESRFDIGPIRDIVRYIKSNKISMVHAYMSMGSEFGLIAAKWCGIPVITSSIRNGMNRDWRERIRTSYQSHLADLAVANSRAGLTSRFDNIKASFRVVHNGFDLNRFEISDADRAGLLAEFGLDGSERIVGMAARMEPQKDHATLLKAVALASTQHPNIVCLLAGQGTLQSELEAQARNLGLGDQVRFVGQRRDVEAFMSLCEISLLLTNTTLHLEGISNTIIESMAVGTAVIATRGGGTDEILPDEDLGGPPYRYGIKVDPFDAEQVAAGLNYYLSNDGERTRLANAAKAMVLERFNLERFIQENVELYQELEGNSGPSVQR